MSKKKKPVDDDVIEQGELLEDDPDDEKVENEKDSKIKEEEKEENPLDKLKEDLKKQKDSFVRLAAEYDNFRKRSAKEKDTIYHDATAKAVETLLPVLDSLEFAMKAKDGANEEFQKGLELMKNQFETAFEKLGVSSFGKAGDEFDPNIHNAVLHIEDENITENTIVEVFQTGYQIGDRVIRHAMVKVAN